MRKERGEIAERLRGFIVSHSDINTRSEFTWIMETYCSTLVPAKYSISWFAEGKRERWRERKKRKREREGERVCVIKLHLLLNDVFKVT